MTDQLTLFANLTPTPAIERGASSVWQHSWCGTLVCHQGTHKPGPCPSCARPDDPWWRQRLPVGPITTVRLEGTRGS